MPTMIKSKSRVITVASKNPVSLQPNLPRHWRIRQVNFDNLMHRTRLTPITVVETVSQTSQPDLTAVARALAYQQRASNPASFIVFCASGHQAVKDRVKLLEQFPRPEMVEITDSFTDVAQRIEGLVAKCQVLEKREPASVIAAPRPSPIDQVRRIVEATNDLREGNGNLSVKKVAALFGSSLGDFERWLGRTRQALSKTPDADSLQDALGYFERIARLRAILKDDAEFRKWLRIANPALDGKNPMTFLEKKLWQELADFVDDILTGNPD